ncbi:MAG: 16S rRNA (cytidine(1402)-2'-O)-methyltransferase [Bacilli bacterium]
MRIKSYNDKNCLYLIPTPIGNMDDITLRAIKTLDFVDFLLCEDTRVTGILLKHLNIKKKMYSCHEFNEDKMKDFVVSELKNGKNIGLVTDRGTPIISDPGHKVVREVVKNSFPVVSLPGATAFVPALTMSGLNPSPFLFYGFLENTKIKKRKQLERLKNYNDTLIFYESPNRIKETLLEIKDILGDRNVVLVREISKLYEESYHGKISEVLEDIKDIKGEIVLVVEKGEQNTTLLSLSVLEHINLYLDEMDEMSAIKLVAKERNMPKSEIYSIYHRR